MWPKEGVIELEDGRKIRLIAMYRHDIYANLMEGAPFRESNYYSVLALERAGKSMMDWAVCGKPPAILPTRICKGSGQLWTECEWYQFRGIPEIPSKEMKRIWPEWMPGTGTIALFRSDAIKDDPEDGDCSHLMVIWFQKEPVELIEPEALASLRKVSWDSLATSWTC
jgi:hypothetical protein